MRAPTARSGAPRPPTGPPPGPAPRSGAAPGDRRPALPESPRRRGAAVLDAYLTCWTDFAPLDDLGRLAECALRVAPLHRVAAWLGILRDADDAALARHGGTPWAWLRDVTTPVRLTRSPS